MPNLPIFPCQIFPVYGTSQVGEHNAMLFGQIEAILGGADVETVAAGTDLPPDPEVLQTVIESSQAEIANLLDNITEEERKMEQYRVSTFMGEKMR